MTEVLSPPAASSSPSPSSHPPPAESPDLLSTSRPRPRSRVPSYAQNRMSQYSQRASRSRSRSRAASPAAFPAFQSSLPYALVRDFAYELLHPMHYGPPPEPPSAASTPGAEWNPVRRLSEPLEGASTNAAGSWSTGPWGGDGVIYGDLEQEGVEPLPSTSFGDDHAEYFGGGGGSGGGGGEERSTSRTRRHRKSKSYANIFDYERSQRRGTPEDMFLFSSQQSDLAGRDSLRQSRSYGSGGPSGTAESGSRRDAHGATTLPSRSFGASQPPSAQHSHVDLDSDLPLDSEIPTSPSTRSPQRQSIGPDDEDLYAGQSLALYPFEPENPNELRLTEGQVIMVSYRHGQGWLVAEDPKTGEQGLVPEEYVRLLSDLPHYDPETGQFQDIEDVSETAEHLDGDLPDAVSDGIKAIRVDEAYEEPDEPLAMKLSHSPPPR